MSGEDSLQLCHLSRPVRGFVLNFNIRFVEETCGLGYLGEKSREVGRHVINTTRESITIDKRSFTVFHHTVPAALLHGPSSVQISSPDGAHLGSLVPDLLVPAGAAEVVRGLRQSPRTFYGPKSTWRPIDKDSYLGETFVSIPGVDVRPIRRIGRAPTDSGAMLGRSCDDGDNAMPAPCRQRHMASSDSQDRRLTATVCGLEVLCESASELDLSNAVRLSGPAGSCRFG